MKTLHPAIFAFFGISTASMRVRDPSDVIPPSSFAADNSLFAEYRASADLGQAGVISAENTYTNEVSPPGRVYTTTKNDTSVVLAQNGARLHLDGAEIRKSGYSTDAYAASLYGRNAAVNIANGAIGYLSNINITTHNGAANAFVYGSGSRLNLDNAWLYSSGPVARGIGTSGNGSAVVRRVRAYSGGMRSSIFAGGGGLFNISSSTAHTSGIGSACFSIASQVFADEVLCETERAPMLLMDGPGYAKLHATSSISGRLASTVVYNSGARTEGAVLDLDLVELTVTGADMPALWFGNTIATAYVNRAEINTMSKQLVVANRSVITSGFDGFAAPDANSASIQPAVVNVLVTNSKLTGDIVALRGSEINLFLQEGATLTGTVYTDGGNSSVNVHIRGSASWTLTNRAEVNELRIEDPMMKNIITNGHNLFTSKKVVV